MPGLKFVPKNWYLQIKHFFRLSCIVPKATLSGQVSVYFYLGKPTRDDVISKTTLHRKMHTDIVTIIHVTCHIQSNCFI